MRRRAFLGCISACLILGQQGHPLTGTWSGDWSSSATQRTQITLVADGSSLLRLVMSQGLSLTAGGIVLGAAAALGLTRLMGTLLYKVSPRDPLAFGFAFMLLAITALVACLLPAWRAARTDPIRALRD